jgi:NAD/NADP transhydrogenase beta subunit
MAKSISPSDYSAATSMARIIVPAIYFIAGILVGFSLRGLVHPGKAFLPGLIGAIIVTNLVIWMFAKISLPKAQARLDEAIAVRDGQNFARYIIKREMTRMIQPFGGMALTIGLVLTIIALRQWH